MALQYSKWFNENTPKDEYSVTKHTFNHINIVIPTVFSSLKQGDTWLVPGILSGISVNDLGHVKERFSDIEVESGVAHAFSLVELGE